MELTNIYYLEKDGIPFYVGKSKNLTRRRHSHYNTYGTNIKMVVLEICENKKEIWKFWERFWIFQFQSWGFNLANKNYGGGGPTSYTEEQKLKMRKSHPGSGNKISKSLIAGNHSKYYTQEVKNKISNALKGTTKIFTNEHIDNIKISKRKTSKRVIMMDQQENFIREWESKGQASEWIKHETGKTSNITSQIKDNILGRQKSAFGYKWIYKEEYKGN